MQMTEFKEENILETAMKITDKEDAKQYLEKYIQFIQDAINKDDIRIGENAEETAKSNLGYFAGYFSDETRKQVEELFTCKHPFFGSIKENGRLSAKEVFELGKKMGTKVNRKSKINKINKINKK